MSETPAFLTARLASEGEKIIAFFESLDQALWETIIYTEGAGWTVRGLLAHLVTSEQGFLKLFSGILAGGEGAPADFDIDRYNAGQQSKTNQLTPAELLEQYRTTRAEMIALVATFSPLDLEKQGRHPFLGPSTLAEMVKMIYRHNQIHLRDLRKLIQT